MTEGNESKEFANKQIDKAIETLKKLRDAEEPRDHGFVLITTTIPISIYPAGSEIAYSEVSRIMLEGAKRATMCVSGNQMNALALAKSCGAWMLSVANSVDKSIIKSIAETMVYFCEMSDEETEEAIAEAKEEMKRETTR